MTRARTAVTLIGVDGAKGGWISVWTAVGSRAAPDIRMFADFVSLVAAAPDGAVIAVDMPMGLRPTTEAGGRPCEIAARALLGGARARSIFSTPGARAVQASCYEAACAIVRDEIPGRKGVSKQSWMIAPKIREVDAVVMSRPPVAIRECHPEVAFAVMNGGDGIGPSKKSTDGEAVRLRLLKAQGLAVAHVLPDRPRGCGRDDLIDAFACLWSARRIAGGKARVFGERDAYAGQRTGIWV